MTLSRALSLFLIFFLTACSNQTPPAAQPPRSPSPTLPNPTLLVASPSAAAVRLPTSTPMPQRTATLLPDDTASPNTSALQAVTETPAPSPTPAAPAFDPGNLAQIQTILPFDLNSLSSMLSGLKPGSGANGVGGGTQPALPSLLPPAYLSIAFSPDGQILALGGCTGITGGAGLACLPPYQPVLRLVDIPSGQIVKELKGPTSSITGLVFTRDGKTLISASEMRDGNLRFWDAASGSLLKTIPLQGKLGNPQLGLSPDGSKLAIAWSQNFQVLDLASGQVLAQGVSSNGMPRFSQDSTSLALFGADDRGSIAIYDTSTWKPRNQFPVPAQTLQFALSPDGRLVVTAGEKDSNTLHFWDAASGKELGSKQDDISPANLSFTPDGKTLIVAGGFKGAKYSIPFKMASLWDPANMQPTGEIHAPSVSPRVLTISADGSRLAYADFSGIVAVWGPADQAILEARKVLLAYLDDLNQGKYNDAAGLFYAAQLDPNAPESQALKKSHPRLDQGNIPVVLQTLCADKRFPCAKFRDFVYQGKLAAGGPANGGVTFYVEFAAPDGSAMVSSVPCSQSPSTCQPTTAFQFNLGQMGGAYRLASLPPAALLP